MPEALAIFGARPDGSAKVVFDIVRASSGPRVAAFLDDDQALWGTTCEGVPVVGGRERLVSIRDLGVTHVVIALGNNRVREQLLNESRRAGLEGFTAVHPTAVVAPTATLGVAVWVAAGAIVNPGAAVGDGAVLNTGAIVEHDCRIGHFANISPGCRLSGRTIVGNYAFLGTGVVTLPGVCIGDDAIVGAGAVVTRDVISGTTVIGVPARARGQRQ